MNHDHWLDELARYLESQIPGRAVDGRGKAVPPSSPRPELIAGLFERQCALNPAATRWLAAQPGGGSVAPAMVRSLADLPAIPVAAFKQLRLTTVASAEEARIFHSSGTTGHRPSQHVHSECTLAIYRLAIEAWFRRCVLGDFDWAWSHAGLTPARRLRFISLTPPSAGAPHSSLAYMVDFLAARFGAENSSFHGRVSRAGWELDLPTVVRTLQDAAADLRPVVVLGTAFNFVHLLDELATRDEICALPPGSRLMETGGYKGRSREVSKSELHSALCKRLGLPPDRAVTEYGMSELSSQAYDVDCSAAHPTSRRWLRFPPWCFATIVSPETRRPVAPGQPGLLRIADLANVASVLAVQTEDLAIAHADGIELLGRAPAAEPRGCSLLPAESRVMLADEAG